MSKDEDRCAHVTPGAIPCGLRRGEHLESVGFGEAGEPHAFVEPAKPAPVDDAAGAIAERCRSRAGLGSSLQGIIQDAVREGIAEGVRMEREIMTAFARDRRARCGHRGSCNACKENAVMILDIEARERASLDAK
jgi:hypothetical protein